ncbi:hypothetical protein LTR12_008061 [Friedmanniomyces endolithicus]|nr:hypothetical protein LTR12_008061 [Friedmanniomyces endolithicus]
MAQIPPSLERLPRSASPTIMFYTQAYHMGDPGSTMEPRKDTDIDGGSTVTHEDNNDALDSDRLLEDGAVSRESGASTMCPQLEPDAVRKPPHAPWQLVFNFFAVVFIVGVFATALAFVVLPTTGLTLSIYDSVYPQLNDLGPLHPPSSRTRFAGAVHATPDGNGLHVPSPALDALGRRFTGPPSQAVDAAWHDLIYGRYVRLLPWEVAALNRASDVPALALLPITDYLSVSESDNSNNGNDTVLVPQEGYYGGPDMLHSLHCIHTLYKHFNPDYYGDTMTQDFERLHIDHCLDQLRQAVLCHGDMTPVTLRPVRNAKGEQWALLGETERKHRCRDGEALGREWREKGEEQGRVESE